MLKTDYRAAFKLERCDAAWLHPSPERSPGPAAAIRHHARQQEYDHDHQGEQHRQPAAPDPRPQPAESPAGSYALATVVYLDNNTFTAKFPAYSRSPHSKSKTSGTHRSVRHMMSAAVRDWYRLWDAKASSRRWTWSAVQ